MNSEFLNLPTLESFNFAIIGMDYVGLPLNINLQII